MPTLSEQLANLSLPSIIAIVVILLAARFFLKKQKAQGSQSAAEVVESVLIAVVLVFLVIKPFIIQTFFIPSESMVPTLEISDHILVNKFLYRFHNPSHGDIVVFKAPTEATHGEDRDFIKRLIGLPGDTIEIKDGAVYRNNERLSESYILEPPTYFLQKQKVPAGKLFVMGDNRNNSADSHVWGMLDENRLIGKASFRFWPLNRIGILH